MEELKFDVVITDMDMPKMDGMDLIKHVVEHKSGIDVIAITGHTIKYTYTDVIAAGAADFITKPFSMNELEAKLNRLIRERHLRQELERMAVRDPLTGLYNRRFFQKLVRKEVTRVLRYNHSLFMLYFDIDRFKEYNDCFGHQCGDRLLITFAEVLSTYIREDVDSAYRFGGDEFTVILPYLNADAAVAVAQRIRDNYDQHRLQPTTISVGIARFLTKTGNLDHDVDDMVRRADMALYETKNVLGRNKTHVDQESLG
jgi:diguanylate cyclase (GGDEF)-like protein